MTAVAPHPSALSRPFAWAAALLLGCAGCASVAPPAAPLPPASNEPPSVQQRAAAPAALVKERQWLQSWFNGTPVVIAQRGDGAVDIAVPREFCFDTGASAIKPPLAAVLNKLAESLLRVPSAQLALLAAPADAGGTTALARQRALQVQKYLVGRGVATSRAGKPTVADAAEVQLRLQTQASVSP